jgi:predicted alpha/beta-fold hydrolase
VFADLNMGLTSFIESTAEYYCSFYSTDHFPDSSRVIGNVRLPTLIISGVDDPLTKVYKHKALFAALAKNNKNQYMQLSGNHKSVLTKHAAEISEWIAGL